MRDFSPAAGARRGARTRRFASTASAFALLLAGGLAHAADVAPQPAEPAKTICDDLPSISTSVDIPGLTAGKKYLCDHGINLYAAYIGEVFGNVSGGIKQNARYEHRVEFGIYADMEKLAGVPGLTFHANGYNIAGQSISSYNLLNYSTISNIAAPARTLLFELWAEQKLFDDKLSIRLGQLAADSEFFQSRIGGLFTNAAFGWPTILAADLPSGGPAYPFATPGVRVRYQPTEDFSVMAAIFNGDPTGAGFGDVANNMDVGGAAFRLKDSPFAMAEAAYSYNQKGPTGLAGTIKFGGWNYFGNVNDQRFDANNVQLAAPFSNGTPKLLGGTFGLYGVIDQMLWRFADDDPTKGLGFFARVAGTQIDRNDLSFYVDGGFSLTGFWSQRPDDAMGVALTYAEVSPAARGYDVDTSFYSGDYTPARTHEVLVELTYSAQIVPGFTVQPVFQYVFNPGAGASNPNNPTQRIPDAAVFGLRTNITF
ncbi:carbohydrate porin [Methylocella sp.]|uniref:carbohydrate porin n=1 Tax=Methylocella sp. TaxID=1978226 RepID=UPI0035B13DF1